MCIRDRPDATCSSMAMHRVGRVPLAPGTGLLCLATQAASLQQERKRAVAVSSARFTSMLPLDDAAPTVRVRVQQSQGLGEGAGYSCLLYTSPSPRDRTRYRMPSSA
eukprot:TRINITY_DN51192_c0_g1_i1.p1 TRINITY_DN51192_c0_g1~~TRINITY_DN51192_c0_g1_i1.p1  ORF type:complete len:107 (+),score=22.32 TRINITY_DN51192_c0_g1_i1:65-385(+)